jgi:ribosomal protein S18 acetylase RimI-like enzyme
MCQRAIPASPRLIVAVLRIEPFSAAHALGAGAALRRAQDADPTYPPADVIAAWPHLDGWLTAEPVLGQWVALDLGGSVVGHVVAGSVHGYLVVALHTLRPDLDPASLGEVGRLFVDPASRDRGVGAALLSHASVFLDSRGLRAALAVLGSSRRAIALYRSLGWEEAGSFAGKQGLNHVFLSPAVASEPSSTKRL